MSRGKIASDRPVRDDSIRPATRWVGRILVPILAVAWLILFGFPDRTTELFAWTIRPDMTPILMGAGYGTGAYFFYRVATGDAWHEVALVFPGIVAFTWFMAIATALHWENFAHGHTAFVIWTVLYAVSPLLVPAIWLHNRRTDPHETEPSRPALPRALRVGAGVSGLVVTLTAVALFVTPSVLVEHWPWDASPLTARVMLGWFVLFGIANVAVAHDGRPSATRIVVETQLVGFGLLALGAVRARGDFDPSDPLTWAFLAGLGGYLAALLAVYTVRPWR